LEIECEMNKLKYNAAHFNQANTLDELTKWGTRETNHWCVDSICKYIYLHSLLYYKDWSWWWVHPPSIWTIQFYPTAARSGGPHIILINKEGEIICLFFPYPFGSILLLPSLFTNSSRLSSMRCRRRNSTGHLHRVCQRSPRPEQLFGGSTFLDLKD
jgi:hypothetical protein